MDVPDIIQLAPMARALQIQKATYAGVAVNARMPRMKQREPRDAVAGFVKNRILIL
jgi:hypothetical protein